MEDTSSVRVPPELHQVPPRPVEEYVRARLIQFAVPFARRINPDIPQPAVQQAAAEAIATLPPPVYGPASVENRDLQLVFRHDCLSLGCLDPQCVLCEHNPNRRCAVNFAPKYLVNDTLKAKCEAPIRVEIIDRSTGIPVGEDIQDVHLEMCVLDGNAYDAKCLETGMERDDDLDSCSLLTNNKQSPLLVAGGSASVSESNRVVVQLTRGMAQLPDLHVSDSSEALLSGRKPPFRLLVRAVHDGGAHHPIRHAVSEGFVVATRRTRTAGKVEIPNVDDHVSKLEHMGKETVKKLQDIRAAAHQSGVEVTVPVNCINKVGEFRKLALLAEGDGHLRQKLQQVLKLSKEKWDEARDHAMRAVVADNRMRIWYADKDNMEVGLLFTCRLGNVDLERPVGLLQKKSQEGAQTTMEATLMAQQTPQQREQVQLLQPRGVASWWQGGHPGWAIYPVDSEHFMSTGALESLPADQGANGGGSLSESPAAASGRGGNFQFGGGGSGAGAGAGVIPDIPPELAGLMQPGRIQPLGTTPQSAPGRSSASPGLANGVGRAQLLPPGSSASGRSSELQLRDLPGLGGGARAGSLGSTGGINLPNLSAFQSSDLDQLGNALGGPAGSLGGGAGYAMGSMSSLGLGNLESMELPDSAGSKDPAAVAAMLHDLPAPASEGGRRGSNDQPAGSSGTLPRPNSAAILAAVSAAAAAPSSEGQSAPATSASPPIDDSAKYDGVKQEVEA